MVDIETYSGSGVTSAGFITAFFVVLLAIPSLIKVAKLKHLVDEPSEDRKLHSRSVPTIGGIVIFGAIIFSYSLWFPEHYDSLPHHMLANFKYLIAILILLFFVGVKDDIIGTDPLKKLVAHVMVGFILVVMAEIRIESMHGLFGVHSLDEPISILLSLFVYIVIVNAVNLIDGLDGLAAGIGFIIAVAFGFLFYFNHNVPLSLLGFVLAGALLGFLVFNFSPARIFMGDSGSLTIGAIISVLALNAVNIDTGNNPDWLQGNMPILVMAILVYPLVDTLRVFTIRALKGQSPFTADKNHIHHRFILLGYSHRQTVLRLYGLNVIVIVGAFLIERYIPVNVTIQFLLILAVAGMLTLIPFVMKPKSPVNA
ncbi:MAG: UDP-GlcNAc:undecaprenyl-phosphate GlcNAc-1-phosphate transferase [Flavobacteriales bacterium]